MEDTLKFFSDFFSNYILISAIGAWLLAQIFKVFTGMFKARKFSIGVLLFSNGGMPSSHSAAVSALAASTIIVYGVASFECAISTLFAIIVMNDALGVRYETGKQAKVLNKITKELFSGNPAEINTGLKELVGHTPFQVVVGAALGIAFAVVLGLIMV